MLKKRVKDFLDKQLVDFTNFRYEMQEDNDGYLYVVFDEVFGEDSKKEIIFRIIKESLYIHSTSFGWKDIEKSTGNKFFWIELLNTNI
ncbi:MAG: hypothetical protein ACQERD_07470 [Campylobacterota bacterium]